MKSLFTLVLFSFASLYLTAQTKFYQNFGMPDSMECPFDSTTKILGFPGWEAYQTLDGTWDGEKDSSHCIDFGIGGQMGAFIRMDEIDTSAPVFLRYKFDSSNNAMLNENGLYQCGALFSSDSIINLKIGTDCENYVCSGVLVSVAIPDSTGTGNHFRNNWILFEKSNSKYARPSGCFATEKFINGNILSDLVFKIKIQGDIPGYKLKLTEAGIYDYTPQTNLLYEINPGNAYYTYTNQSYKISFRTHFPWPNQLVAYHDTTYPSPSHISYIEIVPPVDSGKQETLNLYVGFPVSLHYQPFTAIRGAEVSGDTIRHLVNIVINGGDMCLQEIVELIFEGGNNFIYKGGDVGFNGPRSCFMFGRGSALKVADSSTFHYGAGGAGILMLKPGGTIEIGRDAELVIHNRMMLREYENAPGQVYMSLNEGSKLTFAEGSRLSNAFSFDGSIKLNVYMNGGFLDDSGLPAEDRQLINRIYTENSRVELEVFPNPVSGDLHIKLPFSTETKAEYTIYNMNGKTLHRQQISISDEYDQTTLRDMPLLPGIYILEVKLGQHYYHAKFIKL